LHEGLVDIGQQVFQFLVLALLIFLLGLYWEMHFRVIHEVSEGDR
jgi:HAMP domain-containing protein